MPGQQLLARVAGLVRTRPDDPALVSADGTVTYGELGALVETAHARLEEIGLPPGAPVCVRAVTSPATIALVLAALRAGSRVLLPSVDLAEQPLRELCRLARCTCVLAPGDTAADVVADVVAEVEPVAAAPPVPDGPGLMLTTSGSTGTPKVVPLPAAAVDRFADWAGCRFALARGTTVLSYAPLNFDLSLLDVWTALGAGAAVVLVEQSRATDTGYLLGLFDRDVHVVQAVPMLFRLLADGLEECGRTLPAARHVLCTGDVTSPALLRRLAVLFPNARLVNLYGCTETNDSFLHDIDVSALSGPAGVERVPIGEPLPGVDAVIVDEQGRPVHGAGTGELWVRTPFQTVGYLESWRDHGAFGPHPDGVTSGIYYRTGDVVTRAVDGVYTLDGRTDHQVKVRGVRTNTVEVERVLAAHPEVHDAVVVALPDELAGARLHAVVHRAPGSALNSLTLRMYCATALPRTAIPGSMTVGDDPVPRTATGKPDRNRVKQNLTEEAP